jgi:hypothetical protein
MSRTPGQRGAVASVIAIAMLTAAQSTAVAGGGWGGGDGEGSGKGSAQDGVIRAETKITVTTSGSSGSSKDGTLTPSNSNWTPPACWYEPSFSPKEIEATVKAWRGIDFLPFLSGIGDAVGNVLDHRYKDGHPYKDYNLDKQGKGMFWAAVKNPNRLDDPEANSCDKQPFWVDAGRPPAEPLAVSPKILAEYAYDELPVPGTEIEMAPTGESTVNLPTWVWLDKARFKKISVTASLPGTGLSATTTAEPVSLRIDPGTADAETYPASGECAISTDGSIGAPYTKGKADQTPPCGVTYLRSTGQNNAYPLQATVTWKITWTSTTGEGGRLPDGTFGATQDVNVREIQSVNR